MAYYVSKYFRKIRLHIYIGLRQFALLHFPALVFNHWRCLYHAPPILIVVLCARCERSWLPRPWSCLINVIYLYRVLLVTTTTSFNYWLWEIRNKKTIIPKMLLFTLKHVEFVISICNFKKYWVCFFVANSDVDFYYYECYYDF